MLVRDIFEIFMQCEDLLTLPVVSDYCEPIGVLYRYEFFERVMLGRYGYGFSLNYRKRAKDVMREDFIAIEGSLTLEEAGSIVSTQLDESYHIDIIITRGNTYRGILPIRTLLYFLSQKTIRLAKETNPLTGLPGNWSIRREVEKRLSQGESFEVIYIDLNDFKPFNDHYGFEAGDRVIQILGETLMKVAENFPCAWLGHIGGDDFVVVVSSGMGEPFCETLIKEFEKRLPEIHSPDDFQKGYYESLDRQGKLQKFPLLSLSCAIVPSESFNSYGELSSRATELKKFVKRISKEQRRSFYMRDRRRPQRLSML